MCKVLKSPSAYVQGPGVSAALAKYMAGMGNRILVLMSEGGFRRFWPSVEASFAGSPISLFPDLFHGECSRPELQRIVSCAKERQVSGILGIGGGKVLDTAKGAACLAELPVGIMPTSAATDSPCSSLSVVYHEDGTFDRYLFLNRCPDVVMVDTQWICAAPPALLAAGMGDAMATWFEARACRASGKKNQAGGLPSQTASALARLCWTVLRRDGKNALLAAERGICTPAFENIVEANTYLSGVGFESGGLAAAHAIQKGFTYIPELHSAYHGCKVAFCTLVQLALEHAGTAEIRRVLHFCGEVGLPVCFRDFGWRVPNESLLHLAAEKACAEGSSIHNMPFPVTPQMVFEALLEADQIGADYRSEAEIPQQIP